MATHKILTFYMSIITIIQDFFIVWFRRVHIRASRIAMNILKKSRTTERNFSLTDFLGVNDKN
jgi:hypothetical protein